MTSIEVHPPPYPVDVLQWDVLHPFTYILACSTQNLTVLVGHLWAGEGQTEKKSDRVCQSRLDMRVNTTKPFTSEKKRAALELCEFGMLVSDIRNEFQMPSRVLRRVFSFAKQNPEALIADRKAGCVR